MSPSLITRGGFPKDLEIPSTSNGGLNTGMTFIKCLHTEKWKVVQPSEKVITFVVGLCSWVQTGTGTTSYMLRFFMNPTYSGGAFGASTTWRDVTPYFIDIVQANLAVTRNSSANFSFTITAPSNGGYFKGDLPGGYMYIEDSTSFTSPQVHVAEGDKIVAGSNDFDASTNVLTLITESDHSTMWGAAGQDIVRYHKNLEIGKIPYTDLCSTSSTFFDQYSFETEPLDDGLLVSIHTGDSGRASFTFYLKYIKRTLFGDADIWSRADYVYNNPEADGMDKIYDKHLIYGSPGYDSFAKTGNTSFNGKPLIYYTGVPSSGPAGNGQISSYEKINGGIKSSSFFGGPDTTNKLYKIGDNASSQPIDIKIVLDDFFFQEFDVHGRYGIYHQFDISSFGSTEKHNSNIRIGASGGTHAIGYYNRTEFTASANLDGLAVNADETAWTNGYFLHGILSAKYNSFRFGMHTENTFKIGAAGMALGVMVTIPASVNRFVDGFAFDITAEKSSASSIDLTAILASKVILNENLESATGWDLHLCFVDSGTTLNGGWLDGFRYVKVYRYDKQKEAGVSLGGNHKDVTGNPAYSKKTNSTYDNANTILSYDGTYSSGLIFDGGINVLRIGKDFSFGSKSLTLIRDRLFVLDSQYQEYQHNLIQGAQQKAQFNVFFSSIAEFGGNFHLFNTGGLQFSVKEIGKGIAVTHISGLGGELSNQNRNNLLVLCEEGYMYVDLADNDEIKFGAYLNKGHGCVSRKSVVTYNGLAFWAGENDVYMFSGQQAIPITALGNSKIQKTWKSISHANKQNSVGVYNGTRNQYWLMVNDGTLDVIYVFDFNFKAIYRFSSPIAINSFTCAGFIENKLWISGGISLNYYDETAFQDWNGTELVYYNTRIKFNNIKPSDRVSVMRSWSTTITNPVNVTSNPYVDDISYSSGLTETSGIKKFTERKVAVNRFSSGNNRGRRFALDLQASLTAIELFDVTLNIDPNIPQKTLIKGIV